MNFEHDFIKLILNYDFEIPKPTPKLRFSY